MQAPLAVCLVCAICGACAEAGRATGGGPTDAPATPVDGTRASDARVTPIDAPAQGGACATTATCMAPTMNLGSLSGDTGAGTAMATGYQSAWYQVRFTEDDSGVLGVSMTMTAELTSPAATNYDLYLYINTGSDTLECTTPNGAATKSGTTQTQKLTWGETGTFSNGSDDGRTVV
ncbi:MAG: hypothetical protein ABI467_28850, partial [Kofleriaceae bacterium]